MAPALVEKSRDDERLPPSRCDRLLLPPPSMKLPLMPSKPKAEPLLAIVAAALLCVEEGGDIRADDAAEEE